MRIIKLIIRLLFRFKVKKIGKLEKGGTYIMVYEAGTINYSFLKHIQKDLYKDDNIRIISMPVIGGIDKVRFL